jgi:uncharacterized protein (DUF486 family)
MQMTSPRLPATFGMPVAGLLWSLATLYAEADLIGSLGVPKAEASLIVVSGGMALTFAIWIGFAAVTWAMIRALGGVVPLLALIMMSSGAALPLWIAAPAAAVWHHGTSADSLPMAMIALIGLALFAWLMTTAIAATLCWSVLRAAVTLGGVTLFLASFVYLSS